MTELRGPESTGSGGLPKEGVSLLWLAAVTLRERRLVGRVTALGVVVAVAIVLLRPAIYTTAFTFLPQATDDQSRAGLASLAGQFGISLAAAGGSQQSPQLYADLLTTRRVLGPIAEDSFPTRDEEAAREPLATFLDVGRGTPAFVIEKTLRALREEVISTSVASRTTGVVTVNVRTRSPRVSLAIAERLLSGLNEFNQITRKSQAREERLFTEERLADARVSLRGAEDELQRFLQSNRQADFPTLTFQRDRLQREVTLRQDVVRTLAQKYEENRIREVRDTPVITVIEIPELAARPDKRHRALILLFGTFAAFCLGLLTVFVRETWMGDSGVDSDLARDQLRREWRRLRGVTGS